ncbi:hypothetical protein SH580_07405 [Coraliomargarita algicola]|uniref:N-acetyltransferase domain-containing protein n=1 Tax=Coraliomargarita algicola TaxID=3092156 RepID=A0ABZ0RRX4_9BACT|nr:hypothetical protein [Coraliomargarita sp. J2-16]WPJ97535.1 hypothetical protein SH580_07405 [Coraliomargarita sp. J2-16]
MIDFKIVGDWSDERFDVIYNEQCAGYQNFIIQDDGQIHLADLIIYETVRPVHRSWLQKIVNPFYKPPVPTPLRQNGIGQALLSRLIRLAKENKARTICGSITEDDEKRSPLLVRWYQKNGFIIGPPIETHLVPGKHSILLNL